MGLMMDELKAEINTLERQGQQPSPGTKKAPEQPQGVVAIPSEAVIAQPLPGTVPIEGEITEGKNEVSIYGFAMLDSGIWVVGGWLEGIRKCLLETELSTPQRTRPEFAIGSRGIYSKLGESQ
jgi:hypothetical protein